MMKGPYNEAANHDNECTPHQRPRHSGEEFIRHNFGAKHPRMLIHDSVSFFVVSISISAQAQCLDNLFMNGDMNGTEGPFSVADDWQIGLGSPDLNDEFGPLLTTCSCNWLEDPTPSPNGGMWQNLYAGESISQVIPTEPGTSYSICFYYAQQPFSQDSKDYTGAFSVRVYADGELYHTSAITTNAYAWQYECSILMVTSTSCTLTFEGMGTGWTYGAIDGLCMQVDHTSGAQEALRDAALFAPNPAVDHVQVLDTRAVARATLTNAAGQSMPAELNGNRISLSGVEPGIYTVQCWFAYGGAPHTQRVVVVREQ